MSSAEASILRWASYDRLTIPARSAPRRACSLDRAAGRRADLLILRRLRDPVQPALGWLRLLLGSQRARDGRLRVIGRRRTGALLLRALGHSVRPDRPLHDRRAILLQGLGAETDLVRGHQHAG